MKINNRPGGNFIQAINPVLRLLTAIEFFQNAEIYANHRKICHIAKTNECPTHFYFETYCWTLAIKSYIEEKSNKDEVECITEAIEADALESCALRKYASVIH